VTCGLKDATADKICQILKAAYESCRFPHSIADYSRLRSVAIALAKAGADPELVDPHELDCNSRDAFFESLERLKRRFVPETKIDAAALIEELQRALEMWRSGVRTSDVIHAIEDAIKTLAELGERREAWRWYELVRKEYKIPISIKIRRPTERRASRRRAAREVETVMAELAREDAIAVELARKVLEHWMTDIKRQLPPIPGLRWESHVDRVAVRISLILSPGDVETENKVLEKLSVLHATYGLERRETTTRNRRFIHYIADLERHENFRRLVDVMKVLYRLALDEVRKVMPAESYNKVVATALETLNNWITIHDVYTALAQSPSPETLKRLLKMYPLVRAVEREVRPGVVERVREVVPVRRRGPSLEEEYKRTFVQTIREMAIRDALRAYETGALVAREPDGTTRECIGLCIARLIDALYRADRITREEWENIRKALDAGLYRPACQAIRQNMDYFQLMYGVKNPPRYCEKPVFKTATVMPFYWRSFLDIESQEGLKHDHDDSYVHYCNRGGNC
jgi:hypothetical protein